jgi:hypothetical protein
VNPQEFIAALSGPARTSAAVTKIPASFVVADAALESGWGTSQLSLQAFNLFGVKSTPDWTGPTIDMPTGEFVNGQRVTVEATWRKYGSWLEASFCIHEWLDVRDCDCGRRLCNRSAIRSEARLDHQDAQPEFARHRITTNHARNIPEIIPTASGRFFRLRPCQSSNT